MSSPSISSPSIWATAPANSVEVQSAFLALVDQRFEFGRTERGAPTITCSPSWAANRAHIELTRKAIFSVTCRTLGVSYAAVIGPARYAEIAKCRHVIAYLLRFFCGYSMCRIARLVGCSDHKTIAHAINKVARLIASDTGSRPARTPIDVINLFVVA